MLLILKLSFLILSLVFKYFKLLELFDMVHVLDVSVPQLLQSFLQTLCTFI
jgi:hypothetical protein